MSPNEFISALEALVSSSEKAPVAKGTMLPDRINLESWHEFPGTDKLLKVRVGPQWVAVRYYIAERGSEETAFLLVSGPTESAETVRLEMRLMIQSKNAAEGIIVARPHLKKEVRAKLVHRLASTQEFPRMDKQRLLLGALDVQFFLALSVR